MEVRIVTSGVSDGNMSPRWGEVADVARKRSAFYATQGIDAARSVMCRVPEVNGTSVVEVGSENAGKDVVADALVSRDPSISLALLTADCLPVIMSGGACFGIAHCGWSSTDQRLAETMLRVFGEYGVAADSISVWIGPSIRAASYSLPAAQLTQKDARWAPYLRTEGDRVHIDLHGYVRAQCIENGVSAERITVHPSDTFVDRAYFSHRRSKAGGREGRMMTLVSPYTL